MKHLPCLVKRFLLLTCVLSLTFIETLHAQEEIVDLYSFPDKTAYNYMQMLVFANEEPSRAKLVIDHTAQVQSVNPHPMGLWYDNARKSWFLYNEDMAPFPKDIHLVHVLHSYSGFSTGVDNYVSFLQVKLTAAQIQDYYAVIDDPSINNNPELRMQVTHLYNNDGSTTGLYNPDYPVASFDRERRKWILYNKNKTPLKPGLVFNLAAISTIIKTAPKQPALAIKTNAPALLKQEKIKFRVTINGFTCHTPTSDHVLEADGKGDEVFFGGFTQYYKLADSSKQGPVQRNWSVRYGDINSEEGRMGLRIKAGSKPGSLGGVQTGDQFPALEPWKRKAPVYTNALPLLLTEGVLLKGVNSALVVPAIWEFDGTTEEEQALNRFAEHITKAAVYLTAGGVLMVTVGPVALPFMTVSAMMMQMNGRGKIDAAQPADNLSVFAYLDFKIPEFNVYVAKTLYGDAKDRPVGMHDVKDGFEYRPLGMMLNYDNVIALSRSDFGYGPGIVPIRYKDAPSMAGDYTMYLQIETTDEKSEFDNISKVAPVSKANPKPYRLQNVYSGMSLMNNATGPVANQAPVANKWQFELADRFNDVYYIKNLDGRYLYITPPPGVQETNGFPVKSGSKPTGNAGKWKVVSNSDGTYTIINMYTKKALIHDGPSGRILIWENRANPEQRWMIGR
jgi:hypothetical protein